MIDFGYSEMEAFLLRKGFDVRQETVPMTFSTYHNGIEREGVVVYAVYLDGEPYERPGWQNFERHAWLKQAFDEVFRTSLLEKL